jgi:TRAP-type mannitol/chloroaromatic compound transport system substrate-binding protein
MQASSADFTWKSTDRYSKDYLEMMEKQGVKFYKTPEAILRKQLEIWDQVVAKKSAENPMFKKVLESQRQFAARAVRWDNDTNVDYAMAYNHFFAKKAASGKKG